jgi:phenylacetate-CoA ligase
MRKRAFWNQDKLRVYQNEQLRKIVKYAYENSHFYRRKFGHLGIRPEEIRTVEDLKKLPITRKEELIANLNGVVSSEFEVGKLKVQRTSGSTGRPLYLYLTQAEDEYRKAKHLRAHTALGQKPWDKWVTVTSPLHFAETTKLQRILNFYAVNPISVFEDVNAQISQIGKLKPDVLDGYSNSIVLLAKKVKENGLTVVSPKFLVGGAELIDNSSRDFVEKVFGAPFYDEYACVEFERLAWQCREKNGYHIDADSVVMEFLDESGEETAPGETGEIVCTSLFNYAMPLIRYALDDTGVPSRENSCPCGRSLPLMNVVTGRKDSLLVFPNERVLAPFAFIAAMMTSKFYQSIELFRVVQKREDLLVFKLKMKKDEVSEKILERELKAHLAQVFGMQLDDVEFMVEFVDDIPLDRSGKFRIVSSELNICE